MHTRDYMNTKNWPRKALAAVATFLLMAGCGGGGSGGVSAVSYTLPTVSSTPVAISSTNYSSVSQDAMGATTGSMSAGAGGIVAGVATSSSGTKVHRDLNDAITKANRLLIDTLTGPQTAAGASVSQYCNGYDTTWGTETISYDASGDFLIQFNNCGDPTLSVINGAMAATNVSYTGTPPSPPFSLSVSYSYDLTFTNYGSDTIEEMGSFDIGFGDDGSYTLTSTISSGEMGVVDITTGDSLVISNMNNSRSCDYYDPSTYACLGTVTISDSYTVGGTLSSGSFTVTTPTPLQVYVGGGALYPNAGVISIAGASGSYMTITAYDDDIGTNGWLNPAVTVYWNDGAGSSNTINYSSWTSI